MKEDGAGEDSNNAQPPASILIVDDFPVVRRGLRLIIDAQPDMHVCAEAGDAAEALLLVEQFTPKLALVDISLGGSHNGIELTGLIRKCAPETRVLIVSMHQTVSFAKRAFAAGAAGYALKSEPPADLILAIRRILVGKTYANPELSSRLVRDMVTATDPSKTRPIATLSNRELTLFELMGRGLTYPQIADQLGISAKTVTAHQSNIRRKFNGISSAQLAHEARQWLEQAAN